MGETAARALPKKHSPRGMLRTQPSPSMECAPVASGSEEAELSYEPSQIRPASQASSYAASYAEYPTAQDRRHNLRTYIHSAQLPTAHVHKPAQTVGHGNPTYLQRWHPYLSERLSRRHTSALMLQSSATFWHLRVACTAFCAQHERGKHSASKRTLKLRRWHNVECVHKLIGIANSSDKIQCFNVAVHARASFRRGNSTGRWPSHVQSRACDRSSSRLRGPPSHELE